jgi:hypothetical protein
MGTVQQVDVAVGGCTTSTSGSVNFPTTSASTLGVVGYLSVGAGGFHTGDAYSQGMAFRATSCAGAPPGAEASSDWTYYWWNNLNMGVFPPGPDPNVLTGTLSYGGGSQTVTWKLERRAP